jgi:hypothetical protein
MNVITHNSHVHTVVIATSVAVNLRVARGAVGGGRAREQGAEARQVGVRARAGASWTYASHPLSLLEGITYVTAMASRPRP